MLFSPKKPHGFTIVELLIVIVVIAILAAISIVAYNGIQNRANDATVESDLATIAKKLEIARVDLNRYPRINAEFPTDFKLSKGAYKTDVNNAMYCVREDTAQYALGVTSKSGTRYILTQAGLQKGVADAGSVGACAAIGTTWTNTAPTSVIHGCNPGGSPTIYTACWTNSWSWTN